MMAAMMLPTAMPMVTVFATLNRRRGEAARTVAFVAGYLGLWTAFAAAATAAQWTLQAWGPLIADDCQHVARAQRSAAHGSRASFSSRRSSRPAFARAVRRLAFCLTDWRDGLWGAARMGVRHGLYCLGCCWALMALLFVGGAMNLHVDRRAHPSRRHGETRSEGRHAGEGAGRAHDRSRRSPADLAGGVVGRRFNMAHFSLP